MKPRKRKPKIFRDIKTGRFVSKPSVPLDRKPLRGVPKRKSKGVRKSPVKRPSPKPPSKSVPRKKASLKPILKRPSVPLDRKPLRGVPKRKSTKTVRQPDLKRIPIRKGKALKVARTEAGDKAKQTQDRAKFYAAARTFGKSVRPEDHGKFVFIGIDGKRLDRKSQRVGYMVFVNRRGNVELVKDSSEPRDLYRARRQSTYNLSSHRKDRAQAAKEHAKGREDLMRSGMMHPGKGEADNVNWYRFTDKLQGEFGLAVAAGEGHRGSLGRYNIYLSVTVETEDGGYQTFNEVLMTIAPKTGQAANIATLIESKLYAFMADQLAGAEMVTLGSARYIGRLKQNQGKDRSEWRKPDGNGKLQKWEKWDFQTVKISRIEWKITRLR